MHPDISLNHTIWWIGRDSQGSSIQLLALQRTPWESHRVPERAVQTPLELCQAWCCDHFPGDPLLVPNHPLGKLAMCDDWRIPTLGSLLEEEIIDVTIEAQYDKIVWNESGNTYTVKMSVALRSYYWPLNQPISPLPTPYNGNLQNWRAFDLNIVFSS